MMIGVLVFAVWHAGWKPGDQWTLLVVASVAIPFATLISVKSSILLGLRNVIQSKIPGAIVRPSSFLIFVAVLYWSGALTPVSAIVFYVVSVAFAFSVSRMLVSRCAGAWVEPSEYDDRRWRASLLPFSGIALIGALNNEVFIPLLGIMANNEEVAYFRVALSLAITTSLPLKIVESVIYPHVSRLYMSGETKRIFRMVFFAGVSSVVLCMPAAAAFIFYGMEIIDLIYGQSYAGAYYPLLTLVVGFTFVSVVGPSMQLLHATEFERDAMVISVVSLLLLLILSATLIPDHGAFGAALAFAIAKGARAVAFRAWAGVRVK
jgi:O-antigen/teichoic acid export membrane protein